MSATDFRMTIFERVRELALPQGHYLLVGSGILEALGIRPAKDLDILVSPELFEALKAEGHKEDPEFLQKYNRRALKTAQAEFYIDFYAGDYHPDPTDLIQKALVIEGIPFLPLGELLSFKKELNRPKDFEDIKLIEAYLNEKKQA